MHVLRAYAKQVTAPVCAEHLARPRKARKLLVREPLLLDPAAKQTLAELLAQNAALRTVYDFRERLNDLWTGRHSSNERLLHHFKSWIADAEASGVQALQEYAARMRGVVPAMPA
jgi:stearoyl-CoA desaturase (delta-9 desaturase)